MDTIPISLYSKPLEVIATNLSEKTNQWETILQVLIPVIAGALLTLVTQLFIDWRKTRKENRNARAELIAKGNAQVYLIAEILKKLAMYKTHKQYYARAMEITEGEQKEDCFKKHYEKGQEQRAIELNLSENIAEYVQIVSHYFSIDGNSNEIGVLFDELYKYKHPKSSKFSECENIKALESALGVEEERLNSEYGSLLLEFKAIQVRLR